MKKILSIAIVAIVLFGTAYAAHASFSLTPFNIGHLTSREVGTIDGVEVEISDYTNSSGVVTHESKTISKAIYATEISAIETQITALQAEKAADQSLSDQLAN